MRDWPTDDVETVDPALLIQPIREALEAAYHLQRRSEVGDIPYEGYDIGDSAKATSFGPEDTFRKEMRVSLGKDALDVLLTALFQLGYEQGCRALREEQEGLSGGRSFNELLAHYDNRLTTE